MLDRDLKFSKADEWLPYETPEDIGRRVARGGQTEGERAALWDCPCLRVGTMSVDYTICETHLVEVSDLLYAASSSRNRKVMKATEKNVKFPAISEQAVRNRVGARNLAAGRMYFKEGALFDCQRRYLTLLASCRGSRGDDYRLRVTLGRRSVAGAVCSCPVGEGGRCKHVAALLLAWREAPRQFREWWEVGLDGEECWRSDDDDRVAEADADEPRQPPEGSEELVSGILKVLGFSEGCWDLVVFPLKEYRQTIEGLGDITFEPDTWYVEFSGKCLYRVSRRHRPRVVEWTPAHARLCDFLRIKEVERHQYISVSA